MLEKIKNNFTVKSIIIWIMIILMAIGFIWSLTLGNIGGSPILKYGGSLISIGAWVGLVLTQLFAKEGKKIVK